MLLVSHFEHAPGAWVKADKSSGLRLQSALTRSFSLVSGSGVYAPVASC